MALTSGRRDSAYLQPRPPPQALCDTPPETPGTYHTRLHSYMYHKPQQLRSGPLAVRPFVND